MIAPIPVSPANGAKGVYGLNSVFFSWGLVQDAVKYRVQVASDSLFTDIRYDNGNIAGAMVFVPSNTFLSDTGYFWRVAGIDAGNNQGPWSDVWGFTYALNAQAMIQGLLPHYQYGWYFSSIVQRFEWGAVEGADFYEFQASADPNFGTTLINTNTAETSVQTQAGTFNPGSTYYARVRAHTNEGNYSPWINSYIFQSWQFRTCLLPNPPLVRKPTNGVQLAYITFTASWDNQSELPMGYDLQVATDVDFTNKVADQADLLCNSYYLDNLDPSTDYYWRVRTKNPSGTSTWSEVWSFKTGASGIFPADVGTVSETLTPEASVMLPDSPQGYHSGHLHGTLIRQGYLYGSSRGQNANGVVPGNIVKVAQDLSSAEAVTPVGLNGVMGANYDDIRDDGTNLHVVGVNGHFIISPDDLSYQVIPTTYFNCFETDGEIFLGPQAGCTLYKYRMSDWQQIGYRDAQRYCATLNSLGRPSGPIPHSNILDLAAGYWYVQVPDARGLLMKVNVETMEVEEVTCLVPQCTDDMTQDDDFVYLGVEQQPNPGGGYNYGGDVGAIAIRKSDLAVFLLPKLGPADTIDTVSYSSTMLGDYLFDCKTNRHIYVIDVSDPTNWAKGLPMDQILLADYDYGSIVGAHIVNEIVVDEGGKLIGTTWETPGRVYRFNITEFALIAPPSVNTMAVGNMTKVGVTLNGFISRLGGGAILGSGFDYGTDPENLDHSIGAVPNGMNFRVNVPLEAGTTYYFRAWAENQAGVGFGPVVSFSTPATGTTMVISGVVERNQQLQGDAVVYLIDESLGSVAQATVSDDLNGFIFFNLSSSHKYHVVAAYKDGGGSMYNAKSIPYLVAVPK